MFGYLLARAGVRVTVLEKHRDFNRDFRGDTVHPSTLQLMKQLGLLEEFLALPHQRVDLVRAVFGGRTFEMASLGTLNIDTPFVALMPQWDFLNFLSGKAKAYREFTLLMQHEATDLLGIDGRIHGVIAKSPSGEKRIEAALVIACDGRHSVMRQLAALPLREYGVPIDVLWFRISRPQDGPLGEQVLGNVNYGRMLILINRGDYFQAGLVIRKGSLPEIQHRGLEAFRQTLVEMVPTVASHVSEIRGWDQVKLLSVQINRLLEWSRPGLLCIGDSAHAMSPVFGVGINLAIQDAVAAANILAAPLSNGENPDPFLQKVQERREFPAEATQRMQLFVHRGLSWVFRQQGPMRPPLLLRIITRIPGFQSRVARTIGMGLRFEHIQTPNVHQS
jgi:2-polyprenyl-6-methoxyphenol hydroxylase-like FAD-dependent oxidoreductase